MSIQIGLGSWTDKIYTGVLFPKGLPDKRRLGVYAEQFAHVEVNSTYYAVPRRQVVANWIQATPPGFVFEIKLPQAVSLNPQRAAQNSRLIEPFLEGVRPLAEAGRLGAFLLVLAPTFGPDRYVLEELDPLAEKLQPHTLAVELRDSGWVDEVHRESTLAYFRRRGITLVGVDMPRIEHSRIMPALDDVTNPRLAYLRLHGRNPEWFEAKSAEARHTYAYPPNELEELAARIRRHAEQAEVVRVVANNHAKDFAPKTALALRELLGLAPRGRTGAGEDAGGTRL